MKRAIFVLFAGAAFVSPAMAWDTNVTKEAKSVSLYLGANGGYQMAGTELDLNAMGTSILNVDGLSSKGFTCGVHGGADYRFPSTPIVLGVVGDYNACQSKAEFRSSILGFGLANTSIQSTWKAGARAGLVLPNGSMVYGGAQYARGEMNVSVPLLSYSARHNVDGINAFGGIEVPLNDTVSIGLQYDWTKYDTANLLPDGFAPFRLDADTTVHAVTARVNVKLNLF